MGVKSTEFVPNNRDKLRANIQAIHSSVANFTRQPVFLLSNEEADQMSVATADLFDAMEWNITGGGGKPNVYIAAFMFAITFGSIELPRIQFMAASARARNVTPTAPASVAEARARANGATGQMDFSADIEASVNQGTDNSPGQYQFN